MKSSFLNSPTLLTSQNENINNPERIANIFNNFFSSIGEKTRAKIKQMKMKILARFSIHKPTKKKSNFFSPLLISINLLDHTVSQVRL